MRASLRVRAGGGSRRASLTQQPKTRLQSALAGAGAVVNGLRLVDETLHDCLTQARADGVLVLQLPRAGGLLPAPRYAPPAACPPKRLGARPAGLRERCPPGADGACVRACLRRGAAARAAQPRTGALLGF